MLGVKGSQVQILSARQENAGDLRKRRAPFLLVRDHPSKTYRFGAQMASVTKTEYARLLNAEGASLGTIATKTGISKRTFCELFAVRHRSMS
jgi:hypothetical protein